MFGSCGVGKNSKTKTVESIAFGSGGGFTGIETTYLLKKGGALVKIIRNDTTPIKTFQANEIQDFFQGASKIISCKHFKPENTYEFIEIRSGSETNRIVWGPQGKAPSKASRLYQQLKAITKTK